MPPESYILLGYLFGAIPFGLLLTRRSDVGCRRLAGRSALPQGLAARKIRLNVWPRLLRPPSSVQGGAGRRQYPDR